VGLVDVLENAEGEGKDAARGSEFAVGGCDEDVAGDPTDAADLVVEVDLAAEVFDSGGEVVGQLRVTAGKMQERSASVASSARCWMPRERTLMRWASAALKPST